MEHENGTLESEPALEESEDRILTIPPIARLRRRAAALIVDFILLGIIGRILVWTSSSIWFALGPYGRIAGLSIALLYFGVMGSRVAGGATYGKRLLGITVRGADGRPIGIGRSFLRAAIWIVPGAFNGWPLPIYNPVVNGVVTIVFIGVGGAFWLTVLFNRRTRQGLHDLVTHTFVLRLDAPTMATLPTAGRFPRILAAVMLALTVVLAGFGALTGFGPDPQPGTLGVLHEKLMRDPRFFTASVLDETSQRTVLMRSHTLRIQVWYKGAPADADREGVVNDLAESALGTVADLAKYDLIRIEVTSAYDLSIATGSVVDHDESQPVEVWRERVHRDRRAAAAP